MIRRIISFEHRSKPLLPAGKFYQRLLNNGIIAFAIISVSLGIGVAGYMGFAHLQLVDAILNASMILGGMGPVDTLTNDSAKLFASFYSLFSGITFLTTVAVLFAPIVHRFFHRFHLESEQDEEKREKNNN
jgi:hypothetical protein